MNRAGFLLASAFALLLVSPVARASEPFPDVMKTELKLAEAPLCTVCHQTLIGGRMTITRPFGITMQMTYGLRQLDVTGLKNALTQMQMKNPPDDSDGDGMGDIAELIAGTDPNVKTGETAVDEGPNYGCQCSTARTNRGFSAGAFAWAAGAVIAGLRARRSRRERVAGCAASQVVKSRSVVSGDAEG